MSFADFVGGYGFSKTRTFNPISYKLPNAVKMIKSLTNISHMILIPLWLI